MRKVNKECEHCLYRGLPIITVDHDNDCDGFIGCKHSADFTKQFKNIGLNFRLGCPLAWIYSVEDKPVFISAGEKK